MPYDSIYENRDMYLNPEIYVAMTIQVKTIYSDPYGLEHREFILKKKYHNFHLSEKQKILYYKKYFISEKQCMKISLKSAIK